jgi:mannose-1-phosphate guanylyltransferase/mannose-6-phosphate isomerase
MDASAACAVVPVIMSGGSGTRLWPLSTVDRPKQFHALASTTSMFQDTLRRVTGGEIVRFMPPVAVSSSRHAGLVSDEFLAAGIEPSAIVLEPVGRNTAAVAAIAAQLVERSHPGALVLLLPADHVVRDTAGFQAAVARGAEVARTHIVTLGVKPTRAESGYGYIQQGIELAEGVFKVVRFAEKPKPELAEAYVASGDYAWNGGIFLFSPDVMLRELRRFRPDIAAAAGAALETASRDRAFIHLNEDAFAACPAESIDYAVMERTEWVAVAPVDIGWADIGSWSELWRLGPQDLSGNVARGDALLLDTTNSLVWAAPGIKVAILGVRDLIVVVQGDSVLVLPKGRAQDLKAVVSRLDAADGSPA